MAIGMSCQQLPPDPVVHFGLENLNNTAWRYHNSAKQKWQVHCGWGEIASITIWTFSSLHLLSFPQTSKISQPTVFPILHQHLQINRSIPVSPPLPLQCGGCSTLCHRHQPLTTSGMKVVRSITDLGF